ncbi:uncharacterized protein LOC141908819 [Tubulanus polymorphus]|uniref:uncharacterized protein LOC141908819 n=1 Tax=Tubulanus polymorphus TaxID=672921 RepID=UPI003DA533D1
MSSPDDLQLILEVQKHENLYNSELPQHSDKELITSTWQTIANNLNTDVTSCRTSWKRLRDCFVRVRKSGNKGRKPKWKYYENLMFLANHVKHRTNQYPSNSSNCDESDEYRDDDESRSDEYISETPTQVVTPVSLTISSADMPAWTCSSYNQDDIGEPLHKQVKLEPRYDQNDGVMDTFSSTPRADGTDHLDDFGKSIASTLRQLSRRTQSWARRKIAEVLYEAEESEYQQMMASLPGSMPVPSTVVVQTPVTPDEQQQQQQQQQTNQTITTTTIANDIVSNELINS